jgi:hypothetical protein
MEGVIRVFSSQEDWTALEGTLNVVFSRMMRTPQPEKRFSLMPINEEEFQKSMKYRHLLFVGTLETGGRMGEIIQDMLKDPAIRQRVEEGSQNIFQIENEWARDQLIGVILAKDISTLREVIEDHSNTIYELFEKDLKNRLFKDLYRTREQHDIEEHLMNMYGWSLRIQHDYFIAEEDSDGGFVFLMRTFPERYIFVRWLENVESADNPYLNRQWVVAERNRIGATYYGGDIVDPMYLFSFESTYLGRKAQITTGTWRNPEKVAGGPFKNFTFYDPLSSRIYMIDIAVHAPGRTKIPLLRRLEIIAETFTTLVDKEAEE